MILSGPPAERREKMGKLQIKKYVLGMIRTNTYLLVNTDTKEAIIIDPADSPELLEQKVTELCVKPVGILLTHGHFDHIGAAKALGERYQIPIGAGKEELDVITGEENMSAQFGGFFTVVPDRLYEDQEVVRMAGFQIQVLHTPGHTRGGVCYYLPEKAVLFAGDTLFCESVGRSDFPTGSMAVLVRSVRGLLKMLPEETVVYPGHGPETTIAHEKEYNPFV